MKRLLPAALLVLAGCVERELRVETTPSGADVYLDGELAGQTPLRQPFTFYGTRDITVRLDGYVPEKRLVRMRPPWFQVLPLDLFFEFLWPGTLRDEVKVEFELRTQQEEPPNLLLERAKHWRAKAQGE